MPNAAGLDELDARLYGTDVNGMSDDGFVPIKRGLDIHGDVVEESFFEKPTDDLGPAAVGVELDAQA